MMRRNLARRRLRARLTPLINGDLPPAEADRVLAAVADDPKLSAELERLRRLVGCLQAVPAVDPPAGWRAALDLEADLLDEPLRARFADLLDEPGEHPLRAEIESHPVLGEEFRRYQAVVEAVRALPPVAPPPGFRRELHRRAARDAHPVHLSPWPRLAWAGASLAVILFGVFLARRLPEARVAAPGGTVITRRPTPERPPRPETPRVARRERRAPEPDPEPEARVATIARRERVHRRVAVRPVAFRPVTRTARLTAPAPKRVEPAGTQPPRARRPAVTPKVRPLLPISTGAPTPVSLVVEVPKLRPVPVPVALLPRQPKPVVLATAMAAGGAGRFEIPDPAVLNSFTDVTRLRFQPAEPPAPDRFMTAMPAATPDEP